MPAKIFSAAILGLDAKIIEIEVNVSYGMRNFEIVGLADKSVQESKERVSAALENSGFQSPRHQPLRVLVSLAPADLKKEGSLYDLPISLGFLSAVKQLKFDFNDKIFFGELALDGRLRPINGTLPIILSAVEKGFKEIILPEENGPEAVLISLLKNQSKEKIKIIALKNLKEVVAYLRGAKSIPPFEIKKDYFSENPNYSFDINFIHGQEYAKRALEISAAGGHNLLMEGPPGTGKTLLAKTLPSILPSLSFDESLEVSKIYSIVGLLPKEKPLISSRPFRSPHHTASEIALIGGGNPPRPGEITLAHRGVLFLDEFPEFHRDVLESLRQPIEEGKITISRAKYHFTFPARFILVAASNPCPCGYFGNPEKKCQCTNSQIRMYKRKLSGPLIDRIDLFINVPQIKYEKLVAPNQENSSQKIKERVEKARKVQKERFLTEKIFVNAEMELPQIKKHCFIEPKTQNIVRQYIDSGKLSIRGYYRALKVARTIADLENSEKILENHLTEALMYRIRED